MSEVYGWTFRNLIKEAASDAPTPGGGSVSALVGAMGTSMVAMVGNLTVGKEKYRDVEPEVKEILTRVYHLLDELEVLVDQDIAEFSNFMAVLKLPKNTEDEKAQREGKRQQALRSATDTPLKIAGACLEAVRLAERLVGIGNKGAISDVGVAAYIAEAALNAALLSVDINLPMITDQGYVQQAMAQKEELVAEGARLKEKAVTQVQERLK